jgi:hypothetical protein
MSLRPLPFTPTPLPDELLSSWIERIGIFYAIGYEGAFALLAPYRPRYRDINHDPDTDPEVRAALVNWTGRDANALPTLLDPTDRGALDVAARLGYCPTRTNSSVRPACESVSDAPSVAMVTTLP